MQKWSKRRKKKNDNKDYDEKTIQEQMMKIVIMGM